MNLLANRSQNSDDILKGRFIRQQLQITAKEIEQASSGKMAGFSSSFWNDRSFSVTDNEMNYEHLKVHRWIDMRTRANKDGSKNKKKFYPIHNRIVMGQYNQLTKELAYGFTQEIKNQLLKLED
jgi:hypothetical protein